MAFRNTPDSYGQLARALHWGISFLVLGLLGLGVYMHELPQMTDAEVALKVTLYSLHKTLGLIVFALALFRLYWALTGVKPYPMAHSPAHHVFVANTVAWLLYFGILITPLAGYLHHLSTQASAPIWLPVPQSLPFIPQTLHLAEISAGLHFVSAALMTVSIVLHIGGVIYHQFFVRDDTLARMLPWLQRRGTAIGTAPPKRGPALAALAVFGVVLSAVPFSIDGGARDGVDLDAMMSASAWDINHNDSELEIQILQMGEIVTGEFKAWRSTVVFDPDDLANSSILTIIDLQSLDLGMITAEALGREFLNVQKNKLATWRSREITELEPGRYQADGVLSMLGIEVPVPLIFTLEIDGDDAEAEGFAEINRNDFGMGVVGYSSENSLGFTVRIRVEIEAELEGG